MPELRLMCGRVPTGALTADNAPQTERDLQREQQSAEFYEKIK